MADLIPFDPKKHKPVKTVGGGSSTEYLASEQSPEGTAWNIPTIWFDSATGKPKYLEGDKAWNEAESYEKRTGKKFPRYKTINDAVSAAKSRSKKGGATKGGLAQSVPKDFAEGGEVMADSEEETFLDRYNPLYGSYRKETPTSVKVIDQALDFTPVGTAKTVEEIVKEGRQDDPNYLQMGLMSLAEVLGYVPAIGPAVKTMARKTPDFVSEFLNKRKSEIIPAEKIDGIILSGKADNKSANEINKQVLETAEREKIPHPKRAFDNPKVEYVDTQTIADNVAQFNFPRYDVGKFGGDLPSGNLSENPFLQEKFDASGQETLKENIFNEGIKEPIEVEVVFSDGGISISEGHHRLQAAIELGISEVPVVVTTKAKPRAAGIEVMRPATLDTGGLQSGQTYSFSELGLEQRLRKPKETPEEIRSRGGTVFSDFATGEVSDRKFPQYITAMREGYYRKTEGFAGGGEVMSGIGSLNETARAMTRGPRGIGSYLQYMAEGGEVAEDEFFEKLVKGVVTAESSGDPLAVSPDGAIGLMQVLPSTARDPGMGLKDIFSIAEGMGYSYPDRSRESIRQLLFVPEINVAVGTQYLKKMLSLFPKTEDGLRAYNAGPTGYRKFLEAGGTGGVDKENFEYPFRVMAFASGTPLPDFKNEAGPELLSDYQALSGMDSPSSVTMFPSRERGVGTNFIASDAEPVSFAVNPAFESTIKPKMRPADPAFGLSDPALGLVPPIERVMRPKMRPASPEAMTIEVDPITGEPVVAPPAESLYEKYSPENMEKDLISGIGSLVS